MTTESVRAVFRPKEPVQPNRVCAEKHKQAMEVGMSSRFVVAVVEMNERCVP